jgi:hypothetical protein
MIYCDYIADQIHHALVQKRAGSTGYPSGLNPKLKYVGPIELHLSKWGDFQSTRKRFEVTDHQDTAYLVTVEELINNNGVELADLLIEMGNLLADSEEYDDLQPRIESALEKLDI